MKICLIGTHCNCLSKAIQKSSNKIHFFFCVCRVVVASRKGRAVFAADVVRGRAFILFFTISSISLFSFFYYLFYPLSLGDDTK